MKSGQPTIKLGALTLLSLLIILGFQLTPGFAEQQWRHGSSLFGTLKYPADFKHFDYINPDAPKGGQVRLSAIGTFDNLNPYTFKGNAARGVGIIYDTLMTTSMDEPSSEYGLLAEAMTYPDDFSSVTYRLRTNARWHDGQPITPDDVVFSMETLKTTHPLYAAYYQNVTKAEVTGPNDVTFTFDQTGNRELPQITGQLPVLPKHWWTASDVNGKPRSLAETTLEVPLGSGPYRVGEVKSGRSLVLERVSDYWARDLPVNLGQNNFDQIKFEYFRDSTIALEAFKGDQIDWRTENSAKNWATAYDIPAVKAGKIILEEFEIHSGEGMQAFAFNIRRDKFADPRVRQALNMVYDFEWANKNLFYGQYTRTSSFFSSAGLAATGLPTGQELAILEGVRGNVPDEVFTTEFANAVNGNQRVFRGNLRAARTLLEEAGWQVKNGTLVDQTGKPFEIEFLIVQPTFEKVILPYVKNLERLGIRASVRTVDLSQYQNRLDKFDFDIVVSSWRQSLSPGNEQRDFWGSEAANRSGSRNLVGIKDPAIDHLIDKVIYATDRVELEAATRALDRVLLWNFYVIPQWHSPLERTARWNRFGRPEQLPEFSVGFPNIWWWDQEKADAL